MGDRLLQRVLVGAALVTVAIVLAPPLVDLGRRSLTIHMAQYVVLTEVTAPLLMYGIARRAPQLRVPATLRDLWRALSAPHIAGPLDVAALLVAHIPAVYALTLGSNATYALELLALLATALPLWWAAANAERIGAYGHVRVLAFVFLSALASNFFGFFLLISGASWYGLPADIPGWDWTPLRDQQTAGGVLVFVPDLIDFVAMAVLFIGWLNHEERVTVERERRERERH